MYTKEQMISAMERFGAFCNESELPSQTLHKTAKNFFEKYIEPESKEIFIIDAIHPERSGKYIREHHSLRFVEETEIKNPVEDVRVLPPVNASQVSSFYPGHEPKNIYQQKERGHKPPINRESVESLNGKYVNIYYNGFGGGQSFRKGWLIVEGDWCYLYNDKEAKGNPGEHHAAFYLVDNEITLIEEMQPPSLRLEEPYY